MGYYKHIPGVYKPLKKERNVRIMQKTNNLQDLFLSRARRGRLAVTVFLMNGYQLRGQIVGFDAFVVILMTDGKQQVIYKHAISTIIPEKSIDLTEEAEHM
jgi:host factor-I protein